LESNFLALDPDANNWPQNNWNRRSILLDFWRQNSFGLGATQEKSDN
jgi:hypothetical protein